MGTFLNNAIAPVSGLLSQGLGIIGAKKRAKRQHKYNMELAKYSMEQNKNLWQFQFDKETAYNDPKAQMDRLKSAGINPHLAYASGGVDNTVSAPNMAPYTAEPANFQDVPDLDLGSILTQYQNHKRFNNEQKLAEANIAKAQADAQFANTEAQKNSAIWEAEKGEYDPYADVYPIKSDDGRILKSYHQSERGTQRAFERDQARAQRASTRLDLLIKNQIRRGKVSENEILEFKRKLYELGNDFFNDAEVKKTINKLGSGALKMIRAINGFANKWIGN